jgi:glycosyltransferase involved in cell wall biosynthesis
MTHATPESTPPYVPGQETLACRGSVVAIWNELTPYRLHVMRRVRRELPDIRVVNVFTHSVSRNSMPWEMAVEPELNVEFEESLRIPKVDQFVHRDALALARWILRIVERENPAFVIMHGHRDAVRLAIIAALRRRSVKMAHASDANVFDEGSPRSMRQLARSWVLHSVLGQMSAYMPMGVAGRAYYAKHGNPGIPHFPFPYEPDYALFANDDQSAVKSFMQRHGLDPSRRRFLFSGRLVPVKRVRDLLDAFSRVSCDFPDWDVVIAGQGPLERELHAAVPDGMRDRFKFLGFLQMDELRLAYRACHALVHPSEREPWALVINEAVAAELAVIATDVTGAAIELVRSGQNGVLFRPGQVAELEHALRRVAAPGVVEAMRARSPEILAQWRAAADPVRGFRAAFEYFLDQREMNSRRPGRT